MNNNLIILVLLSFFSLNLEAQPGILGNKEETIERVEFAKRSTVQILVDNVKSGTGFFVSDNGMVLTNFHVVITPNTKIKNDRNGIEILSEFKIVTYKNDTLDVELKNNLRNQKKINSAIAWDYAILELKTKQKIKDFFRLGNNDDIKEGSTIYTCGYPLNLNNPFISTGLLSTKYEETRKVNNSNYLIEVLLLDITTNKGNSGGPLIILGEKPKEDLVIGITSFIITPFYKEIEGLNIYIDEMSKRGGVEIMGINFFEYAKLINSTVNSNSVGISGAISISEAKKELK